MPVEYPYGEPVGSEGRKPNSPPGACYFCNTSHHSPRVRNASDTKLTVFSCLHTLRCPKYCPVSDSSPAFAPRSTRIPRLDSAATELVHVLEEREGSELDRFAVSREHVDRVDDVLEGQAILYRKDALVDHVGRQGGQNVDS